MIMIAQDYENIFFSGLAASGLAKAPALYQFRLWNFPAIPCPRSVPASLKARRLKPLAGSPGKPA
jgi:hypothetical protein